MIVKEIQRKKELKRGKGMKRRKRKEREKAVRRGDVERKESQWAMNTASKTCTFQHA